MIRRLPRLAVFALGMLSVLASLGCDREPVLGPVRGPPPDLAWDLSASRDVDAIGWPPEVRDELWVLEGERRISLVLPGGRQQTCWFRRALVRREGRRVKAVGLQFDSESLDGAYEHARDLSLAWGIDPRPKLDPWYALQRRDSRHADEACPLVNSAGPADIRAGVDVRPSANPAAPWWVSLSLGLPDRTPAGPIRQGEEARGFGARPPPPYGGREEENEQRPPDGEPKPRLIPVVAGRRPEPRPGDDRAPHKATHRREAA